MANGPTVASRTWYVDRHGESQCLGAVEGEARENPSRLAARNIFRPHHEAGYTSAVVTENQNLSKPLQSGGVHIRPHMVHGYGRGGILMGVVQMFTVAITEVCRAVQV